MIDSRVRDLHCAAVAHVPLNHVFDERNISLGGEAGCRDTENTRNVDDREMNLLNTVS